MQIEYRLSQRKKAILDAIVRDYILHGEPLGSRTVMQRHGFTFSPATIRNDMADLEDVGLLSQPHTSAGRIPSQQGYRFFVDHLMQAYVPTFEEQQFVRRLQQTSRAVEAVLAQAIRILSEATQSIVIAETPRSQTYSVSRIELILIDHASVVLNLLYKNGLRRHSVLQLPHAVTVEALTLMTQYLNTQLQRFVSIDVLFHRMVTRPLEREVMPYQQLLLDTISEIYAQVQRDEKVFLSGTSYLLQEPEFQSMEEAFPILNFLEEERVIHELLRSCQNNNLQKSHNVYCLIGYENSYQELHKCSFIATPYYIDNKASGMIGVLGPTRMYYAKVMALLQSVAGNVTQSLSELFG
jgi:heat-inducible transcriptional repressor